MKESYKIAINFTMNNLDDISNGGYNYNRM